MIFRLVRLIILCTVDRKDILRCTILSATHTVELLLYAKTLLHIASWLNMTYSLI